MKIIKVHDHNGFDIYINSSSIQNFFREFDLTRTGGKCLTKINTSAGHFWVKETPEQIFNKLIGEENATTNK